MTEAHRAILEDEIDTLAGRVGDVAARLELVVKLLSSAPVAEKLGLNAKTIAHECHVLLPGGDRWRQSDARRDRLAAAELDAFRRRVSCAEGVMDLTGGSFPEAWEMAMKSSGDAPRPAPTRKPANVWDEALAHIEKTVNRYTYATWFQPTSLVKEDGDMLIVRAGDELTAAWLQSHHRNTIADAVAAVGRPTARVQFVERGVALPPEVSSKNPPAAARRRPRRRKK